MKLKLKLSLAILISLTCFFAINAQAQTICSNETGLQDGYTYSYWKDSGYGCMALGPGGTFSFEWGDGGNLLARRGLKPGSKNQVVTYGADYQPSGNSFLCVYGWTTDPLVEYYIVESWGSWRPPGSTAKGTISVDGGTYEIYETTRVNQPSIVGTATFQQYWSVRTSKRTSGTIHVGQHFNAWASKGMNLGNLYEVSFCVEAYKSSGTADVHTMSMSTDDGGNDDGNDDGNNDDNANDDVVSAFSTLQAENYSSTTSSTLETIGTPDGGKGIGYIASGDTVTFNNVDFGSGASSFTVRAGSAMSSSIQVRLGSSSGPLLGTISSTSTGGWNAYQELTTNISGASGVNDLVLVFSGPVNADWFRFSASNNDYDDSDDSANYDVISAFSTLQAENYSSTTSSTLETIGTPDGGKGIGYIASGDTVTFSDVDFGSGASSFTVRAGSAMSSSIQVRLGSSSGPLLGTISSTSTGGWNTYQELTTNISGASGVNDLVLVFSGPVNVDWFRFSTSSDDSDDSDGSVDGDNTFHVFLLLGQSNMAGYPKALESDKVPDDRVLVLDYYSDQWRTAIPPLHETWQGAIGPGDWFGKTIVEHIPEGDTIGLVPCAISGERIETFLKNGGSKYNWIIERARMAQQRGGIIEGILFHQGESNNGDSSWPQKVYTLVQDLRTDLDLGSVPFLAGELLYSGGCAGHNTLVNQLPSIIDNCHVISANGLTVDPADTQYYLHFGHDSQVEFGRRYAQKMIDVLGW